MTLLILRGEKTERRDKDAMIETRYMTTREKAFRIVVLLVTNINAIEMTKIRISSTPSNLVSNEHEEMIEQIIM